MQKIQTNTAVCNKNTTVCKKIQKDTAVYNENTGMCQKIQTNTAVYTVHKRKGCRELSQQFAAAELLKYKGKKYKEGSSRED